MSLISRLLGIWAVGKTVSATTPLFLRLLRGMAVITLFAVLAAILLAVLIVGAVWLAYVQLVAAGIAANAAILIIGLVLIAMLLGVAMVVKHHCSKAAHLCRAILHAQAPVSNRIHRLSDAFMSGFGAK